MREEAYAEIAASLKRATKSNKPYSWFFCAMGDDGKPVLLVGKRGGEVRAEGKELKKAAKDKKGGRGRVFVDESGMLVFSLDEGNAPVKTVQKAIRLKLATDPGFKKVKGLLQKSRVVTGDEADELFGATEAESEGEASAADVAKLQAKLDKVRSSSKEAFDEAVGRVGKDHADLLALGKVQQAAKAARDAALAALDKGDADKAAAQLAAALELYEEIRDGAASAGLEVEESESEESETETDDEPAAPSAGNADPAELADAFKEAMDAVNKQIDALRKALLASGDPELKEIAEFGLSALTKGHRVPLQAALMEARMAGPDQRPAALRKIADLAAAFLDHVEDDEIFEACDNNPFGVKVSLRRTLERPLRKMSQAA